ncbi:MAG TPA: hypothetical protein VFQ38_19410 [Longimicrobiales bacterium]|nr:hypothetical protein [Longimicrobiales bacterium]
MYYMLSCFGPMDRDRATIGEVPEIEGVSWMTGQRIAVPLRTPIEVDLDTSEGDALVPMFNSGILLLREDMVAALREAGVDNLDVYDAIIHDRDTGVDHRNYKAVNIVGAVACADLGASQHVAHGEPVIDVDFDGLVIDESKTGGALMFRLAESINGIIVHESVKDHLERAGIPYLDFIEPSEWVG